MESENKENKPVELSQSMETAAATIAARCYQDAAFAKKLREDPRAAIEELCGKKLPESLVIEVHENDGRTWHVPLPDGTSGKELSDDQLGKLSGGISAVPTILTAPFTGQVVSSVGKRGSSSTSAGSRTGTGFPSAVINDDG